MAAKMKVKTSNKLAELLSHTVPGGSSGNCRVWTKAKTSNGYGIVGYNGKTVRAHRLVYQLNHPDDDITDKVICHSCDNPSCINIEHLSANTQAANMLDMATKGRHGKAKLTAEDVKQIRILYAEGNTQEVLGIVFKVSRSLIGRVVRGDHWTHVGA